MRAILLRIAFILVHLTSAGALYAQNAEDLRVSGQIVAENPTVQPGGKVELALAMTPQPGWHGYWKNGGDAGFGMRLEWDLPPGVSISQGRYPVPDTYMLQGLMNHVYERPYAILFDLSVNADLAPGTRLPIRAKGNWLACSDRICLPQSGEFAIDLRVAGPNDSAARDERFDDWLARLPVPLSGQSYYQRDGDRLRLSIPYPAQAPIEDAHFFSESDDFVDYAAPQEFERRGDRLIVGLRSANTNEGPAGPLKGLLRIDQDRGLELAAKAGTVPPLKTEQGQSLGEPRQFLLLMLGALLGGLLLNVMPCVFPILGLKAISLAKSGGNEREARREALAYSAGGIAMAVALGVVLMLLRAAGEQVGWAFQLQSPATVFFLLMLMLAITVNLLGLFELPGGNFAQSTDMRSGFATGALAAFVATPCTGPFMAAALGASLLLPWPAALALFFALGLGLVLPFLAIGFIPALRAMLPRPGPWLSRFRKWMALPMALTVLALLWLWLRISASAWEALLLFIPMLALLLLAGRRQRLGLSASYALIAALIALLVPPALVAAFPSLTAGDSEQADDGYGDLPFSRAALDRLRAENKAVFLHFTADWCITCKANEAAALNREEVRTALDKAGIAVMRGDFTRPNADIAKFLAEHGRAGVPFYLYYPAGAERPRELPQILTPAILLELTSEASR